MTGHAAKHAGILVLHFALNNPLSKDAIICGRHNSRFPGSRRIERCTDHAEWSEDFTLTKSIQRLVSDPLQQFAQNDESDVAVLGVDAGFGYEGNRKRCLQQFLAGVVLQKQLFVGGQAGRVRQQHTDSNGFAAQICSGKLRQN